MKRLVLIGLLLSLSFAAESDIDVKVDIKEIVRQQIEEAKKKEAAGENTAVDSRTDSTETAKPEKSEAASMITEPAVRKGKDFSLVEYIKTNSDSAKYIFFGLASFMILLYVFIRRAKLSRIKTKPVDNFRTNIKLVREEKFIKPIDPELKKIRTNLCLTSKYLNSGEEFITETARKYNLAKTEVLLAQKFRRQSAA